MRQMSLEEMQKLSDGNLKITQDDVPQYVKV